MFHRLIKKIVVTIVLVLLSQPMFSQNISEIAKSDPLIISGAVVSEVECLADDLTIFSDDDCLVTPFGNVDPNDEHGVGTCLSC